MKNPFSIVLKLDIRCYDKFVITVVKNADIRNSVRNFALIDLCFGSTYAFLL